MKQDVLEIVSAGIGTPARCIVKLVSDQCGFCNSISQSVDELAEMQGYCWHQAAEIGQSGDGGELL